MGTYLFYLFYFIFFSCFLESVVEGSQCRDARVAKEKITRLFLLVKLVFLLKMPSIVAPCLCFWNKVGAHDCLNYLR